MAAEIEQAVTSRSPNCDDVALLDRIAQELGPDALTDRWRAVLGDPPGVAEASRALASDGLLPEWRYPYLWSGLLPETAAAAWAEAPATQILADRIGLPRTRDYYLGLSDDPDSDIRAEWVQSPLSADHLRGLGPEQAAREIAAWRPQAHDWGHNYQMLAQTLQQIVGENPTAWLAEPLQIALRLHHPTYISAYLQGAAKAAADNPDAFDAVPVGGLVDVMAMAQQEPWPAEQLDANSQPQLDYDADWLSVRRAGTDMAKALLDSGIGLAGRDDDVWDYLDTEARTNPQIFEVRPVGTGFAEDPVGYMLDNAEGDNTLSDPLFLAINEAGTRAVDAALSFMAAEHRANETVRPQASGLLDWCLQLDELEGAKHRAIIAPNAARLAHILPEWFDQNHSLLFDGDTAGRLGRLTVDMAVKWSRPWEWLLVNHRDSIYDSATRGAERALEWLQVAMLYEYDGYGPRQLAQRLGGRLPQACGALADVIDRIEQPTPEQMGALREFCDAVISQNGGQHAAALGRMAYAGRPRPRPLDGHLPRRPRRDRRAHRPCPQDHRADPRQPAYPPRRCHLDPSGGSADQRGARPHNSRPRPRPAYLLRRRMAPQTHRRPSCRLARRSAEQRSRSRIRPARGNTDTAQTPQARLPRQRLSRAAAPTDIRHQGPHRPICPPRQYRPEQQESQNPQTTPDTPKCQQILSTSSDEVRVLARTVGMSIQHDVAG